jgi:hypothetical protein
MRTKRVYGRGVQARLQHFRHTVDSISSMLTGTYFWPTSAGCERLQWVDCGLSQNAIPPERTLANVSQDQKAAPPVTATEHTRPFAIDPAVFADTRSGNGRTVADHAVLRHWQAANRGRSDRSIRQCGPATPRAALRRSDRQQ